MKTRQIILTVLVTFVCVINVFAQSLNDVTPTGCEENEARLDKVLSLIENQKHSDSFLIVIAYLGKGEQSSELSFHRLHNAKEYLLARTVTKPLISGNKIITAIGQKTNGFGQVEFYYGGKIIERLLVQKNRSLCVDCCENNLIKPFRKMNNSKGKSSKEKKVKTRRVKYKKFRPVISSV